MDLNDYRKFYARSRAAAGGGGGGGGGGKDIREICVTQSQACEPHEQLFFCLNLLEQKWKIQFDSIQH